MMRESNDKNGFLAELSEAEYAAFRSHLAPMELRVDQRLHHLGESVKEIVFPRSGLIAMNMPLRDSRRVTAALLGCDSIVGALAAFTETPASSDAVVLIPGHASRLPAAAFREMLDRNPSLLRHVARHAQALLAQSQLNAQCHAVHPVEARICRWLLTIRAHGADDSVPLIQNTLAQMLGVRRTTVTLVAGQLETAGVIKCHRGYMQIVAQDELERRSCECRALFNGYTSTLSAPAAVNWPERSSRYPLGVA